MGPAPRTLHAIADPYILFLKSSGFTERATFLPQRATASSFTPCLCYKVGARPVAFLHDPHIHLISSLNMSIKTTLVLIFAFVGFVQALPAPAREYFQYF